MNIEGYYSLFSRYPSRELPPADANDCGDPGGEAQRVSAALQRNDLRALSADDLSDYFYLAIRHIGTSEDFRHYLPRILELAVNSNGKAFPGFASVFTEALLAGEVSCWPADERAAIGAFVSEHSQLMGRQRERLLQLLSAVPSN